MLEGLSLVGEECIDISQTVKLVRFEDKWILFKDGKVQEGLWDKAEYVCKGLGVLVKTNDKYRFVWEDGDYEDVSYNDDKKNTLKVMTNFIIKRVGLEGLCDRAFEKNINEFTENGFVPVITDKNCMTLNAMNYSMGMRVSKAQTNGGEIIQCQIEEKFCYGMLNKRKTDWIVDICSGCDLVRINRSGTIIFENIIELNGKYINKTDVVYSQEKVVDTFFGKLTQVDGSIDLYEYDCDGSEIDLLNIGGKVITFNSIVRVWKSNIELLVEFSRDMGKSLGNEGIMGFGAKYYSSKFMLWGRKKLRGDIGTVFCGYAFNEKGEYCFDGKLLCIVQEYSMQIKAEDVKDIIAYYKDNDVWKCMVITLSLDKVMYIDMDDLVYRIYNGWLKIITYDKNGLMCYYYYYDGKVYVNMRLAYEICEEILIGKELVYIGLDGEGDWVLATQDMEPILKRISKENIVEAVKIADELKSAEYLKEKVSFSGERLDLLLYY